MKYLNNILLTIAFLVALPFVLLLGFYICYLADKYIETPRYESLGLPLITDFWTGCRIYTTDEKVSTSGEICSSSIGWQQCEKINRYRTKLVDGIIVTEVDNCHNVID